MNDADSRLKGLEYAEPIEDVQQDGSEEMDSMGTQSMDPEVIAADFPSSMIVGSLEGQLEQAAQGYSPNDYLGPLLERMRLVRAKHDNDQAIMAPADEVVRRVLGRVSAQIEADLQIDLAQAGISAGSAGYEEDLEEVYAFSVTNRAANCLEVLRAAIYYNRKHFAAEYRAETDKKDQSIAQVRKILKSFDDVVIWSAMPLIVKQFSGDSAWSMPMAELLEYLGESPDPGSALLRLAEASPADDFASRYLAPALSERQISKTILKVREAWLAQAAKREPA